MITENQKLKELMNSLNSLNKSISDMEKTTVVQLYNQTKNEEELKSREYEMLVSTIQSKCDHKLWYHVSTSRDDFECRTYCLCKCLDCDARTEERSKSFKYMIDTKESFNTVQAKYQEFKNITKDDDIVYKLLKEYLEGLK